MVSYISPWRRRAIADAVHVKLLWLLLLLLQGTTNSMPSRYNFRNAGRVAPLGLPDPSRTLPKPSNNYNSSPNIITISSRCSCESVLVEFRYDLNKPTLHNADNMVDCHCVGCRRFHVAAFVRYLVVPENDVSVSGDSVVRFRDSCAEAGAVHRIYCRRCSSKLLTTMVDTDVSVSTRKSTILINVGSVDIDSVPLSIAEQWRTTHTKVWRPNLEASWTRAVPFDDHRLPPPKSDPPMVVSSGGCTCGACQYEFTYAAPSEIQHCYCNLCRQLSGGMFMSWVPIPEARHNFRWILDGTVTMSNAATPQRASVPEALPSSTRRRPLSEGEPLLIRYTDIGQRHVCGQCGAILSILYDCDDTTDDDAMIWLAAAGFDSIRFPFKVEPYLDRVLHICCRFKPDWYALPDDGMPQVEDAS